MTEQHVVYDVGFAIDEFGNRRGLMPDERSRYGASLAASFEQTKAVIDGRLVEELFGHRKQMADRRARQLAIGPSVAQRIESQKGKYLPHQGKRETERRRVPRARTRGEGKE